MRLTTLLTILAAPAFGQTTIPPETIRPGNAIGIIYCTATVGTTPGKCSVVPIDTVVIGKSYVGGPTGAIVVDNTKTPPEIDIMTTTVPRKSLSETIPGLWTFTPGIVLPPITLPACDASVRGRIVLDAADNVWKGCNGVWVPFGATAPAAITLCWTDKHFILIAPQTAFQISHGNYIPESLLVFRNGVLMTPGLDYSITGTTVTFTPMQAPLAFDVIALRYQRPVAAGVSCTASVWPPAPVVTHG